MGQNQQAIRDQLQRIEASPRFASSPRLCRFLRFVVEQRLAGAADDLKESLIGVHVFDREAGYDTKSDAIVRVEARRLRTRLQEFYAGAGMGEAVRIHLPKGGYVPEFTLVEALEPWTSERPTAAPAPSGAADDATFDEALPDRRHPVQAHPVQAHPDQEPPDQPQPQAALARSHPHRPQLPRRQPRRIPELAWALATVMAVLVLVFAATRFEFATAPVARPSMVPFTALQGVEEHPAFSPDDRRVAYVADSVDGQGADIFVQVIGEDEPQPVVQTPGEDEQGVAWSPDGVSLAFLRSRATGRMAVMTKSLRSGKEQVWGEVAVSAGATAHLDWSPDGRFLVATDQPAPHQPSRIVRFWFSDGRREWLTTPPVGSVGDSMPAIAPDGRSLAFRRAVAEGIEDVYVQPLLDNPGAELTARRVTFEGHSTRGHDWTPDGKALIVSLQRGETGRRLWRVPLDGGPLTRLMESSISAVQPAVANRSPQLLWVANFEDMNIWAASTTGGGNPRIRIGSTYFDMAPEFSPDGTRIAFRSNRTGIGSIWICDRRGQN
ncbi:MAG: hypothetical protein MUF01_18320, partial [Bryobacterales bacterium]|nr:hypothetical protein [Bryobacterales bacterium]